MAKTDTGSQGAVAGTAGAVPAVASARPTVLIGVTGCVAAYKTCEIIRSLQKAGVRVKVVMTEHACEFVGPTTFRALTREPVAVGLFDSPSDPIHHISLAQEADLFLLAPCTANVLAKVACGIADDLLTTTALACTAPLVVAPAMNVRMYEAAATQQNLATLRERGAYIVEAGDGYLACGDVGRGRLAEVSSIVAKTLSVLGITRDMEGMHVLVTAGPTVEPVDAVRYLSNHSSGKMGYALAAAAVRRGADVTLVSGPVSLEAPAGATVVQVQTACDMLEACEEAFPKADIAVFAAAVADMRPAEPAARKLKKGAAEDAQALSSIALVENPDILATCGAAKNAGQVVVGFAAETDNVVQNAQGKLARKHADLMVANQVGGGKAFGTDNNEAALVTADAVEELPLLAKSALADRILSKAVELRG